ncbi:hypothetical protein Taro_017517 [Colocasia esculenta]|uniref:Uncharacterized protein n=1 Tax=Colocasia esculenta TaxID=4460 RepID=A0A843UTG4_COLES|nr:hypothetical protein [Colocasia esculenta]
MNPRGRYLQAAGAGGRSGDANSCVHQSYPQRSAQPASQHYQQMQPHQQWLRTTSFAAAEDGGPSHEEEEKALQAQMASLSLEDWKSQLKVPPPDTRYKTEARLAQCLERKKGPRMSGSEGLLVAAEEKSRSAAAVKEDALLPSKLSGLEAAGNRQCSSLRESVGGEAPTRNWDGPCGYDGPRRPPSG